MMRSGNSSAGRARPCQGRGREFESPFPLQLLKASFLNGAFLCHLPKLMTSFQPFIVLFVKQTRKKYIFVLGWVAEIMQRPATSLTLT